jgi:hypothetical protein
MVKKTSFNILVLFLIVQVIGAVSAADTLITVKTVPGYEVQLTTYDPYAETSITNSRYDNFLGVVGESGEISFIFSSTKPDFNILLYLKNKEGTTIERKTYAERYPAGTTIVLDLEPEWLKKFNAIKANSTKTDESETNISLENVALAEVVISNVTLNNSEDDSATITQFAVFGDDGSSVLKIIVYIIAGIILIAIIVVVVLRVMKSMNKKREHNQFGEDNYPREEIKVRKLSEIQAEKKDAGEGYNERVDDAEKKLKEALEAIATLRKSDKIAEVKKKIIENEKELMRLRRGEQ